MVESIKERAVGETRTTTLKSLASYSTVRKLLHRVLTTVVKEKRGGKVGRLSKKKTFLIHLLVSVKCIQVFSMKTQTHDEMHK